MMSKKYWVNWAKAAGIRAVKTFAETMLGYVGVSGVALGAIDWPMAVSVAGAATIASVLMSIVGGEAYPMISRMDSSEKECLLYLPNYSELTSLRVGVDEGATITPMENPFRHKIVIFG